jgi:hypothetical protein
LKPLNQSGCWLDDTNIIQTEASLRVSDLVAASTSDCLMASKHVGFAL